MQLCCGIAGLTAAEISSLRFYIVSFVTTDSTEPLAKVVVMRVPSGRSEASVTAWPS